MRAPPEAAPLRIRAGVTQGCPLSSTLFVLSFEALLELLTRTARGVDLVKAFADDVGAISSQVAALRSIPQALEVMRKASGLEPAPSKTQLVLLSPHRPELVARAETAIASLAPPLVLHAPPHCSDLPRSGGGPLRRRRVLDRAAQ